MERFMLDGRLVQVPHAADITNDFRYDGRFAGVVQEVLDGIDVDEMRQHHVVSVRVGQGVRPMAVRLNQHERPMWGVHVAHKSRNPGQSPFVYRESGAQGDEMGWVTLEIKGAPEHYSLTRAYGGKYTPPLPWMISHTDAPGGKQECLEYWRSHAFRSFQPDFRLIKRATRSTNAPQWFRGR